MASETVTPDKPYSSTFSGIADPLYVQRKQCKWDRTSRACWWPFWTLGGDFHDELFLHAKQLITAGKICNIGGSKSAPNIQESDGTITGWFTVTVCRYTMFCLCNTLWPLKSWLWCHSHRTCAVWPRVTSSCFWGWSHSCETVVPRMSVKFKISHWPYYVQLQKKSQFWQCFQQWQVPDLLPELRTDVLWRGQQWPITKVSIYFVINSVR